LLDAVIITRSKSKARPDQYTQISLGSKILKLLLEEWASSSDEGLPGSASANFDDGDDGDWDDDDEGPGEANMLSDMLGLDLEELIVSEDFFTGLSQEELRNDPINNINVKVSATSTTDKLQTRADCVFCRATSPCLCSNRWLRMQQPHLPNSSTHRRVLHF
jgi:hypothetical protein